MSVWDGSGRGEDDEDAARQGSLRRGAIMHDDRILCRMRNYVVAIRMALTGGRVEARSTSAPLIDGGFTPMTMAVQAGVPDGLP